MCRMFGIVAQAPRRLAPWMTETEPTMRSLALADNSGKPNADGWGIGWYDDRPGDPQVVKEPAPASESQLFVDTAHNVSARIALAHIRRSSGTPRAPANTHPFAAGQWLFCHNGHCPRERIVEYLVPLYRDRLRGETDSEAYFALLLQHIETAADVVIGLQHALREVTAVRDYTGLNFLLSDGMKIYAFHYSIDPERHGMVLQHGTGLELVASEPVGTGTWETVPNGALAVLTPSGHTLAQLV